MVIQNAPTIRSPLMDAAAYGPKSSYTDNTGVLTDAEIDKIAKDIKVGRWNVYGAVRTSAQLGPKIGIVLEVDKPLNIQRNDPLPSGYSC